jgi:hypothetical protein
MHDAKCLDNRIRDGHATIRTLEQDAHRAAHALVVLDDEDVRLPAH